MISTETLRLWIDQAEIALHNLNIGERETVVLVGEYGRTEYSEVNIKDLERYITKLKNELAKREGRGRRRALLMRFY